MELAWKNKIKTLSFEIVCNTNSTVRNGAVSSLIKVKSTQQQPDEEKCFLPNPSPVIDSLCPLPTQEPTKSPQQESFLERLGSSSQERKAIPVVLTWSISDVISHRQLIYPPVREITHFSA